MMSMGRNEYDKSGHLSTFYFFEAFNGAFEVHFFSGLHLYNLSKTLLACRDMQLRFVLN